MTPFGVTSSANRFLLPGANSDYEDMGALDRYDSGGLDEREFDALDPDARRAAEAALQDRDRREGRGRSRIAAVMESDDEEETDEDFRVRQRRRQRLEQTASSGDDAAEEVVRKIGTPTTSHHYDSAPFVL